MNLILLASYRKDNDYIKTSSLSYDYFKMNFDRALLLYNVLIFNLQFTDSTLKIKYIKRLL